MEELYIAYFGETFKKTYTKALNEIRDYISKCSDTFTVSTYSLELDDLSKKREDSNYLSDKNISFRPNGIEIIVPLEDFWNDIKNYIPKSVTRLELPSSFIEKDTLFLGNFLNLETLVISDYGRLLPEDIKVIEENTSIKTIYYKGSGLGIDKYAENIGFSVLGSPYDYCLYGNTLYCKTEEPDIYKEIKSYFKPILKIKSYESYELDVYAIERLYDLADDRLKDDILIESNKYKYAIKFDKDKNSYQIEVESDNSLDVNKIVNYMFNKGLSVGKVLWKMNDTNYYDKDISSLEDISKLTELFINYDSFLDASYEDFRGLLESVKWYRKIISDSNLSPVEKVMYAFDILKTFRYNESDENKNDSYAHRIIETGNIVCVGYSDLMKQILNYLDENIRVIEFGLDRYDKNKKYLGSHSRILVKIDDDKYNIHGIFAIDATWDSDKSHKISSDFASDYTSLDLYRFFLVPVGDYLKTFPGDTLPHLFRCYLGDDYSNYSMDSEYKELFGKKYEGNYLGNVISRKKNDVPFSDVMTMMDKLIVDNSNLDDNSKANVDEELEGYLSVDRPSLEQFSEMLVNVRIAEGYSEEEAIIEVEKVIRINKKIIENMNSDGSDIEFFKEEKGVSR